MREAPFYQPITTAGEPVLNHIEVRVVVFSLRNDRLQVLLIAEPDGEEWALPGSRVPLDKSLEATATESVLRLTGLREAFLEQLYTYGDTWRTAGGQRLVSVAYFAIIPGGASQNTENAAPIHKDDCQACWFPVDDLPALIMDHREVASYALRRLRYKLEYTAVGFQLLPEKFSLSELQHVYETILGEKIDKRNFRRRILQAGIIEETEHLRSSEGRPARLYRYRPDAVAEAKARRLFP
ncbi:MAG: NUDIX domain-containing protein [Chloroflexi bacterium]|mgnify:CR=1 FL=1|nr:NUDIX domain-containing protein [Chloroflexota bacterium]